ncbi:MAG: 7-cyano-7-deazaguanine synthase QueC [Gammaproteobacteria bacterium]|nr:7-cyano-7-deazaguanine synthase QueC [Gammaproteobacteria bacterium]
MTKKAVVLLSGGLDSATCLAVARARGYDCYALSLDYGQRHRAELKAAARVAESLGVREHRVVRADLRAIGGSALTDPQIAVPEQPTTGIPPTYVPARNTLLLALGVGWAEVLEAPDLFIGVNAVDYSGYPDCRAVFIAAFQEVARLGTRTGVEGNPTRIHTPLIDLSKPEIIREGVRLGVDYGLTVSCYQADEEGVACGVCDSCRIRARGFQDAGIADPTRYREAPSPSGESD